MKRKITVCALLIGCLSILTYGTMAYFTAEKTATNVITSGSINIELKEMAIPEEGGALVPFQDKTGVMPGAQISKIVSIKNIGGQSAYVRIKLDKAITLAEGITGEVDLSLVTMDINTVDWTEKEGYYYYNTPLEAGDETEPLFNTVSFDKGMSNMYQESKAEIKVNAQATQVANNGDNVFSALGWPED